MNPFNKQNQITLALLFAPLFVGACGNTPDRKYFPDMYDSQAIEDQEADLLTNEQWDNRKEGFRMPPRWTTPQNFVVYPYTPPKDPVQADKMAIKLKEAAGKNLVNPIAKTPATLALGEKKYQTYCEPCHGPTGNADRDKVIFPNPRSLMEDMVYSQPDGQLFHTITAGWARMRGYATQLEPEERWAIINYVRLLQEKGRAK